MAGKNVPRFFFIIIRNTSQHYIIQNANLPSQNLYFHLTVHCQTEAVKLSSLKMSTAKLSSQYCISQLDICINHEPLLLDRTVCLPLYSMQPSFGYFSTVIVNFSCANPTTSANFRSFFLQDISYTPTDLSLLKGFQKNSVLKIFIIFKKFLPYVAQLWLLQY